MKGASLLYRPQWLSVVVLQLCMLLTEVRVHAAVDQNFCDNHIPAGAAQLPSAWKVPLFKDNFKVIQEGKSTVKGVKHLMTGQLYFSQSTQSARLQVDTENGTSDLWALGLQDAVVEIPQQPPLQFSDCKIEPLDKSRLGKFLSASEPDENGSKLGSPSDVLQWSKGFLYYNYNGTKLLADRGINTDVVQSCHYDDARQETSVGTFYFSRPGVSMPGEGNTPLLIASKFVGVDKSNPTSPFNIQHRTDYTDFEFGQFPSEVDLFRLDPNYYCHASSAKLDSKKLPTLSATFRYRMEKITQADDFQSFNTFKVTYLSEFRMYMEETVTASPNQQWPLEMERDATVDDFKLGIQYTLDSVRGSCRLTQLDPANQDVDKTGTYVTMASEAQIFYLDTTQYQYLGVQSERGIECDVWNGHYTGNNPSGLKNALYTWYFASESWKAKYRFSMVGKALPVAMTIMTINQGSGQKVLKYNFYEYTTKILFQVPDISPCYKPENIDNFWFLLKGSYTDLVVTDFAAFKMAVLRSLLKKGNFMAPSRIGKIDVMSWSQFETMVTVTLFDLVGLRGNVRTPVDEPTNDAILESLRKSIDSGEFDINIMFASGGSVIAKAKVGSLTPYDPQSGVPTQAVPTLPTQAVPTLPTQRRTTRSSHYLPKPNQNQDQVKEEQDTGYSSGDMAGLAIGMILLSVGITLGAVYLLYKFKFRQVSGDSVAMSHLSHDA